MAVAERDVTRPKIGARNFWSIAGPFAPLIFLFALMAIFAVLEPRFLDPTNLFNVMRQISITGLIALGMTFVILTAGIDLSVGSLLAVSAIVAAGVVKGSTGNTLSLDPDAVTGNPWYYGMVIAIGIGLLGGLLQGIAITRLKVPPFVVTLGGLSAFRGLTLWYSNGGPISGFEPDIRWWGQGQIGPVPVPVLIFLVAALFCHIVLRYTRYGRHVYAVGGNMEAARLSGLEQGPRFPDHQRRVRDVEPLLNRQWVRATGNARLGDRVNMGLQALNIAAFGVGHGCVHGGTP